MKAALVLLGLTLGGLMSSVEATPRGEVPPLTDDRAAVVKFFTENEFGERVVERPKELKFEVVASNECYGGRAIHRAVRISCVGPYAPFAMVAHYYAPVGKKALPAFVAMNFDNRLEREKFNPASERPYAQCWPIADFLTNGMATIGFTYNQVAKDDAKACFSSGVFAAFGPKERTMTSWGALSAWAWAASRCVDYLETLPEIDLKRLAVAGHSRLGKTALWAGVTDERFALACINDSGAGGAKLNHMDNPGSESLPAIYGRFPHWFAKNYAKWAKDDGLSMPFDQHNLVWAIKPRMAAIGSATEDKWAGPKGEAETARLTGFQHHYRVGKHDILPEDWAHYIGALRAIKP